MKQTQEKEIDFKVGSGVFNTETQAVGAVDYIRDGVLSIKGILGGDNERESVRLTSKHSWLPVPSDIREMYKYPIAHINIALGMAHLANDNAFEVNNRISNLRIN